MTKAKSIELLSSLSRASKNGKECQVCIRYTSKTVFSWVLIRYDTELSRDYADPDIVQDFAGRSWSDIAKYVRAYLSENPGDGFWWN